jgi:PDZ domain-containing protein
MATDAPETTTEAEAPPQAPPPPRRRRRGWTIGGTIAAAVLGIAAIAAAVVPLPYRLISPGGATPVENVVDISGTQVYEHEGSVLFLTVSVSDDDVNAYTLLSGWLDDDVDVIDEDDLLQGRTQKEEEQLNEIAMTTSQQIATQVALERLGYAVPVTGVGAAVTAVENGSPADGLLEVGDVITAVDGTPVQLAEDVGAAVRARPPGMAVTFTVQRGDETLPVTVTTRAAEQGDFAGQAQVGVASLTKDPNFEFPVDVEIDTGAVGGPSAGLAFTLTILDELSAGNLTGGKKVAVTGTIESDGSVGEIGGVAQKAATAEQAGARLFIVPAAEAAEARDHAGGMKVMGVKDLNEALAALERNGGDPLTAAPVP